MPAANRKRSNQSIEPSARTPREMPLQKPRHDNSFDQIDRDEHEGADPAEPEDAGREKASSPARDQGRLPAAARRADQDRDKDSGREPGQEMPSSKRVKTIVADAARK